MFAVQDGKGGGGGGGGGGGERYSQIWANS